MNAINPILGNVYTLIFWITLAALIGQLFFRGFHGRLFFSTPVVVSIVVSVLAYPVVGQIDPLWRMTVFAILSMFVVAGLVYLILCLFFSHMVED